MRSLILLLCLLLITGCVTNLNPNLGNMEGLSNWGKDTVDFSNLNERGIGIKLITENKIIKKDKEKNLRVRLTNFADHDLDIDYVLYDNLPYENEGISDGISGRITMKAPFVEGNNKIPDTDDLFFEVPPYSKGLLQPSVDFTLELEYDFITKTILNSICIPRSELDKRGCKDVADLGWGKNHAPVYINNIKKIVDYTEQDERDNFIRADLILTLVIERVRDENYFVPNKEDIILNIEGKDMNLDCELDGNRVVFKDDEGLETSTKEIECVAEDLIPGNNYYAEFSLEYPYKQIVNLGSFELK